MKTMELLKAFEFLDDDLIMECEGMQTKRGRRVFSRPVLIAAVIITGILLITACTAMGGTAKFLQYFSDIAPGKLSAQQVEYIVANTIDVNKSQTVNGYTMTLKSVFSDGRDVLMQFELKAPGGEVLDADAYGDMHGVFFESDAGTPLGLSIEQQLQDEDRTDNAVSFVYSIESAWGDDAEFAGGKCHFYIYGLEAIWHEQMMNRSEPLTEGCWNFDIYFPEDCDRSISFVQEPVKVTQKVTVGYERIDENTLRVMEEELPGEVTGLKLWALGAELSFRFGEEPRNADFGELYVVMRDGKKIRLSQSFGMPDLVTYKTETPLILDQVDHLLLEDGTVFPVP